MLFKYIFSLIKYIFLYICFQDFSGTGNVPFTADEFRRWMKIVTEFMIEYYEHPEVYQVTTSMFFSIYPLDWIYLYIYVNDSFTK